MVFYKELEVENDAEGKDDTKRRLFAQATPVFNADQVERPDEPATTSVADLASVDDFIAKTGATIVHGGSRACFIPKLDEIRMPVRSAFKGSATSSATEAYYSTLLHELTHWTAPAHRCGRNLTGRFGAEAYAMEELIAELGAPSCVPSLGSRLSPVPTTRNISHTG